MDAIDRLNELRRKAKQLESEAERMKGRKEESMRRLKEDFDCDDIDEGKKKLKTMQRKAERKRKDFEKAAGNFEEKFDGLEKNA